MKIFLVFALAFIAVSQTVNALKCYQCGNLLKGETCSSNKDKWEEKSCTVDQCQMIDGVNKDGKAFVVRMCSGDKDNKDGCKSSEKNGMKGTVCYCSNEKLCNGAFTAQASIVGTILLVALSFFLSN